MHSSGGSGAFEDGSFSRPDEHLEPEPFGGLIQDLENELTQAQAELEQYQGLLNELPGVYEDKFCQKVPSLAEDIRHLLDERKALQEQVSRTLVQSRQPQALPAAPPSAPMTSPPSPPGVAQMFARPASSHLPVTLFPRAVSAVQRLLLPTPTSLRLQARGGQSWVLVERLDGGKVVDVILEPWQSKQLPLGTGLKIRSCRPDLLYIGVGAVRLEPLGGVSDLDWVEIRP